MEYPIDEDWSWGKLSSCTDGFEKVENISGLSMVRGSLGANETFSSEWSKLLACVITAMSLS